MIPEERLTIKNCCSNVLIVDDEPFNLMPLEKLLSQHSLNCDKAYNGLEALEKVKEK
jgi:CheY-like chemotaxis protein